MVPDRAQRNSGHRLDGEFDLQAKQLTEKLRPFLGADRASPAQLTMDAGTPATSSSASFCGVDFPTRLLTEWVPKVLSFEEAVSRLTSVPAAVHGLADRGVIRVGAAADLLLIDRQQLGVGDTRFVSDFPANTGRLVIDANGYRTSIVNGEVLLQDGVHTGMLPGQILRR